VGGCGWLWLVVCFSISLIIFVILSHIMITVRVAINTFLIKESIILIRSLILFFLSTYQFSAFLRK